MNSMSKELVRQLVCEALRVTEQRRPSAKNIFRDAFLQIHSPRFKKMSGSKTGVRFGLEDPTAEPNFGASDESTAISAVDGYTIKSQVPPGGGSQSESGKYTTYIVQNADGEEFTVVFGSPNKGEKFEKMLHKQLTQKAGPLADEIMDALNLPASAIDSVEDLAPARKRPLSDNVEDVGQAISDITLNLVDGEPLYISLKDPAGSTFMNAGYAGAFVSTSDTVTAASHPLDDFVEALGVNKDEVAAGINDYIKNIESTGLRCEKGQSGSLNPETVAKYLASGLGYGYVYARRHEGGYTIKLLDSPQDAIDLVGQPTSVSLNYPRWCDAGKDKSKQVTASVETSTNAKFTVEIRSSKAKNPVPNEIKIKISRYPDELEARNIRWGRLESSFGEDREYELWAHFNRGDNLVIEDREIKNEDLIREYIREALLTEAFTKTDERSIETMARKEIDKKWKDHEKKIDKMFKDRDKTLFRNDAFYKVIAQIYQQLQRAYAEDQFKYATRYTRKDIPLARFRPS